MQAGQESMSHVPRLVVGAPWVVCLFVIRDKSELHAANEARAFSAPKAGNFSITNYMYLTCH
jgi:hypothetical protein